MTAVEFLHSEYKRILGQINPSTAQLYEIAYTLEQAKQMEKEQIKKERVEAYNNGYANGQNDAYSI